MDGLNSHAVPDEGGANIDEPGEQDMSYENEEFLDPGFQQDPLLSSFQEFDDLDEQQKDQEDADSASEEGSIVPDREPSSMNISINLSKGFRKYQYHFVGVFYSRCFKTQHLADPVCTQDVYGKSIPNLLAFLWNISRQYVSREAVVEQIEDDKQVRWSSKTSPDASDIHKFVIFKEEKTKKLYSVADLDDNSRLLAKWRGKKIQVHVYKYSTSVTSNTIWELVNKKLLHPEKKDRAGAASTEELFECIHQLKTVHSHYTALHSSWVKWASYILSQPGDRRPTLMTEAPPDEYLHLFRAPPTSEGDLLRTTRQGLQVAQNMVAGFKSSVNVLCDRVGSLFAAMNELQLQVHELKAQIDNSQVMLESMQSSLPPQESEFSRRLASNVSDMPDIDHSF